MTAAWPGTSIPTREHFDAFKALPRDTPILMLNLIRLRERAAYPDGRRATGAEAYAAYGRESLHGLQARRREHRLARPTRAGA